MNEPSYKYVTVFTNTFTKQDEESAVIECKEIFLGDRIMEEEKTTKDKFSRLRKKAEKILELRPEDAIDLSNLSHEAKDRLLHELQVYQGELEIQNEELIRAQMELEAQRNKYSDLYDFAPVGYFTISDQGMITEANLTSASLLGVERRFLIGQPFSRFITRDDHNVYYFHIKKLVETKTRQIFELRLMKTHGSEFYSQLESIATEGAEGKHTLQMAVIDISERKQIEEEKKNLEAQIRQYNKMEAIGTLTGGIAHDFNNLLAIILGNTELAIDDIPERNPVRLNLDEARTACLRAKDKISQIVNFAHKTEQKKKLVRLIPMVKETIKLLRASIPTTIDILQHIPDTSDIILAESTQIHQLVINLCTNAAHAMPDGGILEISIGNVEFDKDTTVRYHKLPPNRYIKLTISDTGHGIQPEIKERIFDPYFTTKGVDEGSGLGLSVVHGIVKNHNGAISVNSEPGKGTIFNIYFPIIERVPIPRPTIDEDLPTGTERILLVDDEELIVDLCRQRLERLGYQVESTTSPLEALDLFRSKSDHFDLLLTDLTMPKMTGDILVKEILNIRPDMPIIICTGFRNKMDAEKSRSIGASGYLEKPHANRELAITVRKVLGQGKG